jgi:hypothetical protein
LSSRAETEAELCDLLCKTLVEVGGYRMTWVGFPEDIHLARSDAPTGRGPR